MINDMMIADRLLFLKYALPCASSLVEKGEMAAADIDRVTRLVSEGKVPDEDVESNFGMAVSKCSGIAKTLGKSAIDAEVIREYFLIKHNRFVDLQIKLLEQSKLMGGRSKLLRASEQKDCITCSEQKDCRTYSGIVIEAHDGYAVVQTASKTTRYRTDFCKDLEKKDVVAVHLDFIVERISADLSERMNKDGTKDRAANVRSKLKTPF